jgi:hypothetical protein
MSEADEVSTGHTFLPGVLPGSLDSAAEADQDAGLYK